MTGQNILIPTIVILVISGCTMMGSDRDGDGVDDEIDVCPTTPAKAVVDARGCALDGDRDGVPDHRDDCPVTPRGAAVDTHGCALDSDRDLVPDYLDKCPKTPLGVGVGKNGCALDGDMDGVADYMDRCRNTAKGLPVDKNGCNVIASLAVLFARGSTELSPEAKSRVASVIDQMMKNPKLHIVIEGHTDSRGRAVDNQVLSEDRAEAVMEYMISQGISAKRLDSRGYGQTKPVAPNDSDENMAQNRRIDFVLTRS